MANSEKTPVTFQEFLVSSLASTDALAKLLIEKGLITKQEFLQKVSDERLRIRNYSIQHGSELGSRCCFAGFAYAFLKEVTTMGNHGRSAYGRIPPIVPTQLGVRRVESTIRNLKFEFDCSFVQANQNGVWEEV